PRSSRYSRFSWMSSGMPLKNLFSLTDPLGPPSPLAPLSETSITMVFSSSPDSSRKSSRRPISWSVWDRNPAYTSAIRQNSRWSCSPRARVHRPPPGALREDAQLLLALEHLLAVALVAHVEAAPVRLDPLLGRGGGEGGGAGGGEQEEGGGGG